MTQTMNEAKNDSITRLEAGMVERVGYIQPPNTELRKVWGDGIYHYELRPAGYRTPYEKEIESEYEHEA